MITRTYQPPQQYIAALMQIYILDVLSRRVMRTVLWTGCGKRARLRLANEEGWQLVVPVLAQTLHEDGGTICVPVYTYKNVISLIHYHSSGL